MIDCCFIYIYLRIQLFENFLKSKMLSKFGRQILMVSLKELGLPNLKGIKFASGHLRLKKHPLQIL